jgi:uncharacterized membrane protein YkoI
MSIRLAVATLALAAVSFGAQAKGSCKEAKPGLMARAKVSCTDARKAALEKIGKGSHIRSAELEEENGELVFSFDIKQGKKPGVEEIQIDARTGTVVSARHEDAAAEAAEHK